MYIGLPSQQKQVQLLFFSSILLDMFLFGFKPFKNGLFIVNFCNVFVIFYFIFSFIFTKIFNASIGVNSFKFILSISCATSASL